MTTEEPIIKIVSMKSKMSAQVPDFSLIHRIIGQSFSKVESRLSTYLKNRMDEFRIAHGKPSENEVEQFYNECLSQAQRRFGYCYRRI